jgi:uncharacterized glyoxalase superfamily protein PhnB
MTDMADPLDALHAPLAPVQPDPRFAARLRARLERELLDPEGATMTTTEPTAAAPPRALTPYLAVADARQALDWYVRAFGARRRGEPTVMEDGRVGHAELAVGDSVLMLADEYPELGLLGPRARGGVSVSLVLEVANVDATVARAVELGAELTRPVADYDYGRNGVVSDPFGHRWMISGPPGGSPAQAGAGPGLRQGDVGYASLWVADVERAAAFYASVLGWEYAPGSGRQGRQVRGAAPPLGLWGGQERGTAFLCFVVDDVAAAVSRVRAAAGQADEPSQEPYGLVANCVDDQEMPFAVYQPPAHRRAAPAGPGRPGDLAYLTIEVPDSGRARSFYGAVLGWRFTPGRVADGWGVHIGRDEVRPMTGLHGGHQQPTVVPMYAVDDVAAAVSRVRAAGGTATDPERMPYGVTADCVDDQGTRFYLGQLG